MTTRVLSTNPNTVATRNYFETHPEQKQRARAYTINYILNRRKTDEEFLRRTKEASAKQLVKYKERYANDEEFRKQEQQKALARYYKRKAKKAEANNDNIVD